MKPRSAHPVIGLTLDREEAGGYSKLPWYAIRENYCESVSRYGALPVALPHEPAQAEAYLDLVDGILVTGGAFDVSPELYGAASVHETVTLKQKRTAFEYALIRGAVARNIPVLGICGGEQLLNVVLGGTLIQHIPDAIPNALAHEQPNPRHEPGHSVRIVPGSLLCRLTGAEEIQVNSAHHQAVATVGKGVTITATAPDGVIEAIEYASHPFCLGVEWHPEYSVTPADDRIMEGFVQACASGNGRA